MNYYGESNQPRYSTPSVAADFRQRARAALKNCYYIAVLAALIVLALGLTERLSLPEASLRDDSETSALFGFEGKYKGNYFATFLNTLDTYGKEEIADKLFSAYNNSEKVLVMFSLMSVPLSIGAWLALCGVRLGEKIFYLGISNGAGASATPKTLFCRFNILGKGIVLNIILTIFVALWSLLFVIPGIIAALRYSMATYILAENPDMPVMNAIRQSKDMMQGNKWRLFCLIISFIGWHILASLTAGIGYIFLYPYMETAKAEFYKELKSQGTAQYNT